MNCQHNITTSTVFSDDGIDLLITKCQDCSIILEESRIIVDPDGEKVYIPLRKRKNSNSNSVETGHTLDVVKKGEQLPEPTELMSAVELCKISKKAKQDRYNKTHRQVLAEVAKSCRKAALSGNTSYMYSIAADSPLQDKKVATEVVKILRTSGYIVSRSYTGSKNLAGLNIKWK